MFELISYLLLSVVVKNLSDLTIWRRKKKEISLEIRLNSELLKNDTRHWEDSEVFVSMSQPFFVLWQIEKFLNYIESLFFLRTFEWLPLYQATPTKRASDRERFWERVLTLVYRKVRRNHFHQPGNVSIKKMKMWSERLIVKKKYSKSQNKILERIILLLSDFTEFVHFCFWLVWFKKRVINNESKMKKRRVLKGSQRGYNFSHNDKFYEEKQNVRESVAWNLEKIQKFESFSIHH